MIMQANVNSSQAEVLPRTACPLCGGDKLRPERVIDGYSLERCSRCSFVFVNPRPSPQQLAAIYTERDDEELTALYARIATPAVLDDYRRKLEWIEQQVPGRGRLLDFACAAGYFFELAQQRGWDAHGADLGGWTARAAAARGLKHLHVGTLQEIAFAAASFDVVYAAQVFEHLADPLADLRELRRILKPGGLLYLDVPNYHTLPILLGRDDFMLNTPPQHINYFTPRTLRHLLQSAGLQQVQLSSAGGLKWENLLGRPITSEIASAYGLVDSRSQKAGGSATGLQRLGTAARLLVKLTLVEPLLYSGIRVGMNLIAVGRNPGSGGAGCHTAACDCRCRDAVELRSES